MCFRAIWVMFRMCYHEPEKANKLRSLSHVQRPVDGNLHHMSQMIYGHLGQVPRICCQELPFFIPYACFFVPFLLNEKLSVSLLLSIDHITCSFNKAIQVFYADLCNARVLL
jgi:hypothetical protein